MPRPRLVASDIRLAPAGRRLDLRVDELCAGRIVNLIRIVPDRRPELSVLPPAVRTG